MKQQEVHAIEKHPARRSFIPMKPPRYEGGWHVQIEGKLGYAPRQCARFAQRKHLNRRSVPGCGTTEDSVRGFHERQRSKAHAKTKLAVGPPPLVQERRERDLGAARSAARRSALIGWAKRKPCACSQP